MSRSAFSDGSALHPGERRDERERACALIWAGMVLGVSFLATPAKFLVKSLPRPVALDVGRQTFRTLGYVEMVPAVLLGLRAAVAPGRRRLAAMPGIIVLAQALWLRPRLAARTRRVVPEGASPPSSALHLAYVACEVAKLGALLGLGLAPAKLEPNRDDHAGRARRGSDRE